MKKIAVFGGAGAMGQAIVRDLVSFSNFDQIIIADLDEKKARTLADSLPKKNVTSTFVNIQDPESMIGVLKNVDILINSTPYYFNVSVMNAALTAGCHYLDLGGLFHVTKKQLALAEQFKAKQLLAILGMGAAPGITNVMADYGAQELDKIKAIDIAIGCIDFVKTDHPLAPPYSLDTLLDEYAMPPMVFDQGKMQEQPPMSGEMLIDFPEPVGKVTAIFTLHSEVQTLPTSYANRGIERVTFRLGLPADFHERLKLLVDLGFAGKEPMQTNEVTFVPRKVLFKMLEHLQEPDVEPDDCEVIRVDIIGEQAGIEKLVRVETIVRAGKFEKISSGALDTAAPPSIVATLIAQGSISKIGVYPPELCVPQQLLFSELLKRGIKITKSTWPTSSGAHLAEV